MLNDHTQQRVVPRSAVRLIPTLMGNFHRFISGTQGRAVADRVPGEHTLFELVIAPLVSRTKCPYPGRSASCAIRWKVTQIRDAASVPPPFSRRNSRTLPRHDPIETSPRSGRSRSLLPQLVQLLSISRCPNLTKTSVPTYCARKMPEVSPYT